MSAHIWLFTVENWSLEQVDRYYNLIFDEIEYIAENFETGRDFGRIRNGYRFSKVKSHLIFYKKSKSEKIEIKGSKCYKDEKHKYNFNSFSDYLVGNDRLYRI